MTHQTHRVLRRLAAAGAIVLFAAGGVSADEGASYVVLASTVPAFRVGELIDDAMRLEIPQGGALTLIDAVGKIKVIEGPFLGRLRSDADDDAEPSFLIDLANIIAEADTADVALGMGRTADTALGVSPWLIAFDASLAGDLCVSPEGQLLFARTESDLPDVTAVRFAVVDGSAAVDVAWHPDDTLLRWPSELPAVDGQAYVLDYGAAPRPPEVTMHLTPADLQSDSHIAVWLARNGCTGQAEAMARRLALGG
ncbi:MAG: hypothetical protein R3F55_19420 [Alphaproteobacteria bacterium]